MSTELIRISLFTSGGYLNNSESDVERWKLGVFYKKKGNTVPRMWGKFML